MVVDKINYQDPSRLRNSIARQFDIAPQLLTWGDFGCTFDWRLVDAERANLEYYKRRYGDLFHFTRHNIPPSISFWGELKIQEVASP